MKKYTKEHLDSVHDVLKKAHSYKNDPKLMGDLKKHLDTKKPVSLEELKETAQNVRAEKEDPSLETSEEPGTTEKLDLSGPLPHPNLMSEEDKVAAQDTVRLHNNLQKIFKKRK